MTLTRRQTEVLRLLDKGWVAEASRGGTVHLMRSPSNTYQQAVVRAATIQSIVRAGKAVTLRVPALDLTWVLSSDFYHRHASAFSVLAEPPAAKPIRRPFRTRQ